LGEVSVLSDLETYQIIVIIIAIVAILPGNVVAVGGTSAPVWESAERLGGTNSAWQNELTWVNENTPEIDMELYSRFKPPDDGDFNYDEGQYGIMSWWDYGHWITYTAERIPNANPFQQGPAQASAYLLAENETRANLILEALPKKERKSEIPSMSTSELREIVDSRSAQQANENTRYVIIDDQMAAGKFSAIATWSGPGPGAYFSRQEFEVGDGTAQLIGTNDRY
ncbi:MAG: oligosaccharyl transferase, archaeosortase A system-associated, partial [Halobacteriales archaeon]